MFLTIQEKKSEIMFTAWWRRFSTVRISSTSSGIWTDSLQRSARLPCLLKDRESFGTDMSSAFMTLWTDLQQIILISCWRTAQAAEQDLIPVCFTTAHRYGALTIQTLSKDWRYSTALQCAIHAQQWVRTFPIALTILLAETLLSRQEVTLLW